MSERSPLCRHAEVREDCPVCAPFRAASARRKANGIRLKRFTVMAEQNAVESLNEFFGGWIEALGKERATDYLLVCIRKGDEALRRAMEKRNAKESP